LPREAWKKVRLVLSVNSRLITGQLSNLSRKSSSRSPGQVLISADWLSLGDMPTSELITEIETVNTALGQA
jgi:hypothetical protein